MDMSHKIKFTDTKKKSKAKTKEMAKNFSSVTFSVLLIVLLMASTGINLFT